VSWPAFLQWDFEPVPILAAATAVVLYYQGRRHQPSEVRRSARWDLGDTCFAIGMAALLVALVSPIAAFDTQTQWDHMLQHVILLVLAPPLILLSDPFRTAWWGSQALRGVPTTEITPLSGVARRLHCGWMPALAVLLAFSANLVVWHAPALYNVTLVNDAVHDLEHTLFLGLGLLFWDQVIGPVGSPARLQLGGRAALVLAGMLVSWALAVFIGYASHPLYAYPANAGGLGPLADQEIAAGIMWVPGGAPFIAALVWCGIAWFDREERLAAPAVGSGIT
jgi:putative membrane protein